MIRFFEEKDRKTVILIWQDAFGDNEKYISEFLDIFGKYMLVLEKCGKIVSMLMLFPVTINGEKGRYIYAVATDKAFRNQGFAGELVEYAKNFIKEENEKFLVLLPQNSGLFGFYKKFGFCELKCAKKIDKAISFHEKNDILTEEITPCEYFKLREDYFSDRKYVKWDIDMLGFFAKMYNGKYLKLSKNGKTIACAFCHIRGDKIVISELLTRGNVLDNIGGFFGKSRILGFKESKNGERFAMIYPESFSGCYFGIGMN